MSEDAASDNRILDFSLVEDTIELVGVGLEIAGVAVIVIGMALATFRLTQGRFQEHGPFQLLRYKADMGLALILGLEILVAADIVASVATKPSFESLGILAVLVLIRTFLGWTLELETQGRLPWQHRGPEQTGEGST